MAKKLLSTILRERSETVEYREIKSQLMKCAQNKKYSFRRMKISPETRVMLENEGITLTEINEGENYKVWELTW